MLTTTTAIIIFVAYAIFIIGIVWFTKRPQETSEDFLLMERNLGVFRGSLSMAVSWIWAPAVFICSMQAYSQGLPGIFWFTLPNILCFFVFAPFAVALRNKYPEGYTISEAFRSEFSSGGAHKAALTVAFGYQLGAIVINCVAGATLISLLAGIPYVVGVLMMGAVALAYSLISGLRASVMSDVAQMLMILVVAVIIVPLATSALGGWGELSKGFAGSTGEFGNIFDPSVAYAFGIATTIGLISGPFADQMFSQRAFASKKEAITKIFVFAGLIFGVVPIILSFLGFIGAAGVQTGKFEISDPQMVGPEVVGHLLPTWALGLFAVMAFAGLTSTLDSAFTAIGSLTAIDLADAESHNTGNNRVKRARLGMCIFALVGIGIALMQPKLLWVFLIYGALAASLFFPAFLLVFWKKLTAKGAFFGIVTGLVLGTPLSIFANVSGKTHLIVLSAILGLCVAGIVAVVVSLATKPANEVNE